MVVIFIIALLLGILGPVVGKARRRVGSVVGGFRQKQVVGGVSLFAMDNDEDYPESVATVGFEDNWNWSDPLKMIGNDERSPGLQRSMSGYLGAYIEDAKVMFCPNSPR